MEFIKADENIVTIRESGFDVNMNNMETGKQYSFEFIGIEYGIELDVDGALVIYEIADCKRVT